jgi:hypothetical protein
MKPCLGSCFQLRLPRSFTGPSSDCRGGGGKNKYYAYVKASGIENNSSEPIIMGKTDVLGGLETGSCFFYDHMYGESMGTTLSVDISDDDGLSWEEYLV